MVDEVKIKVKVDASDVASGVRDIKSQFKALHHDSKFLEDLVGDFEKAFKRYGGYMPQQAKKAFKGIKNLSSAISEDETNIAKQSKELLKNSKKAEKPLKSISKSFKGIGKLFSAGAIVSAVRKAISIAEEGREDYYMARRAGISGSSYEAITSGFAALGASSKELSDLLIELRESTLGAKSGLDYNAKTLSALARFGVSNALNKSPEQILYDLADYARKNNSPETELAMRQALGIGSIAYEQLTKGSSGIRSLISDAKSGLGVLSNRELEEQRDTAKSWSRAVIAFDNAVRSLTTGKIGEYLRVIASLVEKIAIKMKAKTDEGYSDISREAEIEDLERRTSIVRALPEEKRLHYLGQRRNISREELFLSVGKKRNVDEYMDLRRWRNDLIKYEAETDDAEFRKYLQYERSVTEAKMMEIMNRDSLLNKYKNERMYFYGAKYETKPFNLDRFTAPNGVNIGGQGGVNINIETYEQSINGFDNAQDVGKAAYNGTEQAMGDVVRDLIKSYG